MEPLFVSYFGHGSANLLAGGLLSNDSVVLLDEVGPGAFWSQATCLTGFFQDGSQPSLAETLLAKPGGGAFGVWASSGLTELEDQTAMQQAFARNLLMGGMPVGEAARRAKALSASADVRRTWILFGDPTWRLVGRDLPATAPQADAAPPADAGAPDAREADADVDVDVAASKPAQGCACSLANGRDGRASFGAWALALLLAWVLIAFRAKQRP